MADTWEVSFFAHLPGVSLEGVESFPIGLGQMVNLPIETWRELDSDFPFQDDKYTKSRPVFYTGKALLPADENDTYHQVGELVDRLHRSLLLAPSVPLLPTPHMSVKYMKFETPDEDGPFPVVSLVGPFEREWVVFGSKIEYRFSDDDISEIQHAYRILDKFSPEHAFRGVEAGLHTLVLTAHPEFWWNAGDLNSINGFIHCMMALENILFEEKEEATRHGNLTRIFGQRAAIYTTSSRDDLEHLAEVFSELYRLRSQLIHGQTSVENLDKAERDMLLTARLLLRQVLLLTMALSWDLATDESLPSILSRAYREEDSYQKLMNSFRFGYTWI